MSPDALYEVKQAEDGDLYIEFASEFWNDADLDRFDARVEEVIADIRITLYYAQLAGHIRH